MGNISDDLDKFLKTDGVKIIMDSNGTRLEPWEPLSIDGFGPIDSIDPESLNQEELKSLLDKAEDLRSELEDQLSEVEDLIDCAEERLDKLEEENE